MSEKLIQTIIEDNASYYTANAFKEELLNPDNTPVIVSMRSAPDGDNGAIHYSDTYEIILFEKVFGTVTIANQIYNITPYSIYLIPPQCVHATRINKNSGLIYVFKFYGRELEKFINYKYIFSWDKDLVDSLPHKLDIYDEAVMYIINMMNPQNSIEDSIYNILKFFSVLDKSIRANLKSESEMNISKNEQLKKLIDWTNENYCTKFSLEDAAKVINFSKYHFCKFFKQNVGITYIEYINQLRIQHAIGLLQQGKTATECCFSCGFESIAYFSRLFKKITGCTTQEYLKTQSGR